MDERPMTEGSGDQFKDDRVEEIFTLVAINEEGDEGIMAMMSPESGQTLPCVTSDRDTMERMVEKFKGAPPHFKAHLTGQRIELRSFTKVATEGIEL